MDYHLQGHVSFGVVGRDIVMLDLAVDRYFRLGGTEAALLAGTVPPAAAAAIFESLAGRGLLGRGPGPAIVAVDASDPACSAIEASGCTADLGVWEVARARLGAAAQLRFHGLCATVERTRRRRARWAARRDAGSGRPGSEGDDAAAAVARGYAAARVHLPAARLCVPDSLALLHCLWRRDIAADLFFGVRLEPFAAHAWVQRSGMILSDPVGTVAEYRAVFRL